MADATAIPLELRSYAHAQDQAGARLDSARPGHRDLDAEPPSGSPGNADVNLRSEARFTNQIENRREISRPNRDR